MTSQRHVVVDDETGEEREVRRWCWRCARTHMTFAESAVFRGTPEILSPAGVAHVGSEDGSERTACGKDATGDRWWHRL